MSYLVDANVLSEPTKPRPDQRIMAWLRQHEAEIVVAPVILGEIRFGILLLHRGARRTRLERWFDEGIGASDARQGQLDCRDSAHAWGSRS